MKNIQHQSNGYKKGYSILMRPGDAIKSNTSIEDNKI